MTNNDNNLLFSIILPCFNMEKYIEQTLLSIINQEYKNYELIIVDGGSSDNTIKIAKKYSKFIKTIISEPDLGQYNAINKGMKYAEGDIISWINSDDIYFPWALKHINRFFCKYSEYHWISGITALMDEEGFIQSLSRHVPAKPIKYIQDGWFQKKLFGYLQQEGMFWRKEIWDNSNGLNEHYKLAADFELWIQFSKITEIVSFGLPLAAFRIRNDSRSKINSSKYESEVYDICKYLPKPNYFQKVFGRKNRLTNQLLRKLTFKKSKLYYYSKQKEDWILSDRLTSLSPHSLRSLILG